jgi:hypothetical protein
MKIESAPNLSGPARRKLREAKQEADREAVYAALMAAIKNPASRPETIVRAAELLQKGFFERGNHWPGGDP